MNYHSNDEIIAAVVSQVLEKMTKKDTTFFTWQDFVKGCNGELSSRKLTTASQKLLNNIIAEEYDSVETFEKELAKQQTEYSEWLKRHQEKAKQADEYKARIVVPEPVKKTKKTVLDDVVMPESEPKPVSKRPAIGLSKQEILEKKAQALGLTVEEYMFRYRHKI